MIGIVIATEIRIAEFTGTTTRAITTTDTMAEMTHAGETAMTGDTAIAMTGAGETAIAIGTTMVIGANSAD